MRGAASVDSGGRQRWKGRVTGLTTALSDDKSSSSSGLSPKERTRSLISGNVHICGRMRTERTFGELAAVVCTFNYDCAVKDPFCEGGGRVRTISGLVSRREWHSELSRRRIERHTDGGNN